jgi:hypothetical protein
MSLVTVSLLCMFNSSETYHTYFITSKAPWNVQQFCIMTTTVNFALMVEVNQIHKQLLCNKQDCVMKRMKESITILGLHPVFMLHMFHYYAQFSFKALNNYIMRQLFKSNYMVHLKQFLCMLFEDPIPNAEIR